MEFKSLIRLCVFAVYALCALPVMAQCPDGKSEVQLTTPSGKNKTICISDAAIPGIENAADHSGGTIIPTTCPCWNEADIKYYAENKIMEYCKYLTGTGILECYDSIGGIVLDADKAGFCTNHVTKVEYSKLTTDQWNSCYKLTDAFQR